jgi:hypothetical protein
MVEILTQLGALSKYAKCSQGLTKSTKNYNLYLISWIQWNALKNISRYCPFKESRN